MAVYVMSDVHGQYNWFLKMLEKIHFFQDDELYIIGDIMDRGPKNLEMFDIVKNTPNIHLVMGNHEEMALEYYKNKDPLDRRLWFNNGGEKTFSQFFENEKSETEIIDFLSNLPYQKEIEVNGINYVLTHSDPFADYEDGMIWSRLCIFDDYSAVVKPNTIYLTGHTPIPSIYGNKAEEKIYKSKDENVWFIDYGCAYASLSFDNYKAMASLGCIRLDDQKLFIVDDAH